ncbi:MAG: recombinase zinc beta ribbon domain-containing protein [Solirubrobacteraceae bacterium]
MQAVLSEKCLAAERPQHRQHYLRGSIFCGECGSRLVYGLSRGRNQQLYPYFFCHGRINGTGCPQRASLAPKLIEAAIEHYYAAQPIELKPSDVEQRQAAIRAMASVSQAAIGQVQEAKRSLIQSLEARQDALLDLRLREESISPKLFKRRQAQLQAELDAAHHSLAESERQLDIDLHELEIALELAQDVAAAYRSADEATKRRLNQAFFRKLYVAPDWDEADQRSARVVRAELTEPYALLLAEGFTEGVLAEAEAITAQSGTKKALESQSRSLEPSVAAVSYFDQMVPLPGFEPGFPP